ncbi:MAG: hypothetical protein M2R45_04347 [Verrucomicrobia subdivision 3 bacterium]|nr:hypothetical protein [Limisphaerales bacterium]MCS1416051.1 hypothetical protein [Limisphaerales bacterium]
MYVPMAETSVLMKNQMAVQTKVSIDPWPSSEPEHGYLTCINPLEPNTMVRKRK